MLDQLQTGPALIDRVHDQLVAAIASGGLAPGRRLTQESVAAMLGVSRQPVSHALQILKRKGLLIEHGKRGLAVAPLDPARITNLYQIREVLDGLAARLAAVRCAENPAPRDDIAAFKAALATGQGLASTIAKTSITQLVAADVAFHNALHRLSANPEIATTVAEQWPQFMRSMGFVLSTKDRAQTIWREHTDIAAAILAGKPDDAERLSRSHAAGAGAQAAAELHANAAAA